MTLSTASVEWVSRPTPCFCYGEGDYCTAPIHSARHARATAEILSRMRVSHLRHTDLILPHTKPVSGVPLSSARHTNCLSTVRPCSWFEPCSACGQFWSVHRDVSECVFAGVSLCAALACFACGISVCPVVADPPPPRDTFQTANPSRWRGPVHPALRLHYGLTRMTPENSVASDLERGVKGYICSSTGGSGCRIVHVCMHRVQRDIGGCVCVCGRECAAHAFHASSSPNLHLHSSIVDRAACLNLLSS